MTTIEVDPGVQALLDALAAMDPVSMADIGPEAARGLFKAMAFGGEPVPVAEIGDRTIPGPAGDIPVRIYRPAAGELPVLVWYHGGGWVIGDLDTTDTAARQLAAEGGCVVVSVDYRLAPEHAFPAAADDAWAALRWVVDHADELGVDGTRVAVGGDSAGGNLAAISALRARDEGLALRHQLLVYPVTDLTASFGSRVENGEGYFLTKDTMDWFESCYLQGQDPKAAGASPLHVGDLAGVAPAHVLTAGFDPLRDEGEAYAEALTAAGVPTVDDRYPTLVHGFFQMGGISPAAGAAAGRAASLLRRAME
jgi:acetyl esterase